MLKQSDSDSYYKIQTQEIPQGNRLSHLYMSWSVTKLAFTKSSKAMVIDGTRNFNHTIFLDTGKYLNNSLTLYAMGSVDVED